MGQLAFFKMFMLVSIPLDINDNRRHIHIFRKGGRHQHSLAKIWIEKGGVPNVEIAESNLSSKENQMLIDVITRNWNYLNDQITCCFNGIKTNVKDLK